MGEKVIVIPSSQRVYVPYVAWLKIDLEEHNITISIEIREDMSKRLQWLCRATISKPSDERHGHPQSPA